VVQQLICILAGKTCHVPCTTRSTRMAASRSASTPHV
jgi:hypothetical protein